jgi:hypothetical protein
MDVTLLSIIIIAIVIVCLFGFDGIEYNKKTIEEMNTQELITDFNLLLESQKAAKIQEQFTPSAFQLTSEPGKALKPGWNVYSQPPFYFWKTHPNKPVFYEKTLYRKPYRFPFGYMSSYPFNHFSNFQN